jgi:hypothetical protein
MLVILQALQQVTQRAQLAMHVANDVYRSVEKRANQGIGLHVASCLGSL